MRENPTQTPQKLLVEVSKALEQYGKVDYVTFVPDGEPTLDLNLGQEISLLKKELNVRIAVITNSSLLWIKDVRESLANSDLVSVKIDAATKHTWIKINRPHPKLDHHKILLGLRKLSQEYNGTLITETMLVKNINDNIEELKAIAETIANLNPHKAYIAVPTRPPAEPWATPPKPQTIQVLQEELASKGIKTEPLTTIEPPPPPTTHPIEYILATTQVHPLPLNHIEEILRKQGQDPHKTLKQLLEKHRELQIIEYMGHKYLIRKQSNPR